MDIIYSWNIFKKSILEIKINTKIDLMQKYRLRLIYC